MNTEQSEPSESHEPQQPPPTYYTSEQLTAPELIDDSPGNHGETLPSYSTPRPGSTPFPVPSRNATPVTHEFHIKGLGKASKPWATLRLVSQAEAKERTPVFTGGQISGSVNLVLDKSKQQSVSKVTLTLRGNIRQGGGNDPSAYYMFLKDQQVIYAKSSSSSTASLNTGKLEENNSWPFSFPFPTETNVRVKDQTQSYPTPQSFVEDGIHVTVQYELVLKISYGILKADNRLPPVNILYIPEIKPTPMSEIRQIAHRDGIPVPGPESDSVGWHTLPPVIISGKLLKRDVSVTCVLSLAKPLICTRGTVIPLHLVLGSDDTQALDILSSVKSVKARLMRNVKFYKSPKQMSDEAKHSKSITQAQWWVPNTQSEQDSKKRILLGELHLYKDMQPSCSFPLLEIEYTVELLPFESPVFEYAQNPKQAVLSCPVKIGTTNAPGPVPMAITAPPPRVDVPLAPPKLVTMGFL